MNKRNAGLPSQRQFRVGEEIRHALAHVLERGELRDPYLEGKSITVTEVRVSPDLKKASAFVVPLGGAEAVETVDALNRVKPFLRHRISQRVNLRNTPEILFFADNTFDEADNIHDLLKLPEVARDLRKGKDIES